jgi:nitroreductase
MPTDAAIAALLGRRSVSPRLLTEPGPSSRDLQIIVAAGLRAPDHGRLRPWRFIAVDGAARADLGAIFAHAFAARHPDATAEQLARERAKPSRAPLVLAVAAAITHDHPSVRVIDQQLAAGAAAMNLLNAAHVLGYGGMWLTGESCHDPAIKQALGLQPGDFIAGWLYLGTPPSDPLPAPDRPDPSTALHLWRGAAPVAR